MVKITMVIMKTMLKTKTLNIDIYNNDDDDNENDNDNKGNENNSNNNNNFYQNNNNNNDNDDTTNDSNDDNNIMLPPTLTFLTSRLCLKSEMFLTHFWSPVMCSNSLKSALPTPMPITIRFSIPSPSRSSFALSYKASRY